MSDYFYSFQMVIWPYFRTNYYPNEHYIKIDDLANEENQ